MSNGLRALFDIDYLRSSYFLQQFAPILVLVLVPCLVLLVVTAVRAQLPRLSWLASMVLQTLGLSLGWNWKQDHAGGSSSPERRKGRKKRHIRTRAEQMEARQNGSALNGGPPGHAEDEDGSGDVGCFPGLVNISGTYCFMNSVAQSMASLAYLQPHIEAIHTKAEELDVPTPVVDALRDILHTLNTPKSSPSSLRPVELIAALSNPEPGKQSRLFSSREHQDAQELFQLLSECIKNESIAVDKEAQRDRGLSGLGGLVGNSDQRNSEIGTSVFDGLTANRRSCVACGYTEAVMHFALNNWQLSLPRMSTSCTLQDCLADYIQLEVLTDCICRKCSLVETLKKYKHDADKLSIEMTSSEKSPSQSKKKRLREAKRLEARIRTALEEGRIEEDLKGVKMEKVFSRASTKQAMIARPPRVLALHLNRSIHYSGYNGRNPCRVLFPEFLDLTPYTTSGQLSTVPSVPISMPALPIPRSTTPTQSVYATPRVLYRLSAVVCHYGQHSFGHYVCFRRKPSQRTETSQMTTSFPQMACPYGCECEECKQYGHIRDEHPPKPGTGWLRISDDSVSECGIERVLAEGVGAFMLFYERAIHPRPLLQPLYSSPRSSEETVRPPDLLNGNANGSSLSLSTLSSSPASSAISYEKILGPRIVQRTTPGRSRSTSMAPPESVAEPRPRTNSETESSTSTSKDEPSTEHEANLSLEDSIISNGSAEYTDEPEAPSEPLPDNSKHRLSLPNGHAHSTAIRTSSSSPTPRTPHNRVKSPQPVRAQFSGDLVTNRATVNLYA